MPHALDPQAFRRALLAHYDAHGRALPWRDQADPYRVWVSEMMLQQTRVDAVIPYYERWMRRFPTLEALAEADVDDVLREWQGLGYYARARNLHRTARLVRERHHGRIPDDLETLRQLPGIGDYTAGAIASIAYGIPAPAVDGNVRRVFSRLLDDPDPAPAALRRTVAALVPDDRPGDFNQALMELGATVCTPRSPACDRCPVNTMCRAYANGTVAERPRPKPKKAVPEGDVGTAVVVSPSGRFLVTRRPEDGLLGGMWEFPGADVRPGETPADAARRAAIEALEAAHDGRAPAPAAPIPLGTVVHTFSHRRTTYHAFRFDLEHEPVDHEPVAGAGTGPGIGSGTAPGTRPGTGAGTGAGTARGAGPSSGAGKDPGTATGTDAGKDRRAGCAWVTPADTSAYALPAAQLRILALTGEVGSAS